MIRILFASFLISFFSFASLKAEEFKVDKASYSLGSLGAFAEMVGVGVKKLGLGSPMTANDLDPLMEEAQKIVARHNVSLYRETDFLVTDLFPASVAKGMDLLIVYKGKTLEEYLSLKTQKKMLVDKGQYKGEARLEIAQKMGYLLSYPETQIKTLIHKNKEKE